MTHHLICIDSGLGHCEWERRETPEGRDECIRQVSLVQPGFRIATCELPGVVLPDDGSPVTITLTLRQVAPVRDPGRGA